MLGVYIETDPNATEKSTSLPSTNEEALIKEMFDKLLNIVKTFDKNFKLSPIIFEKDDDSNYHMDAISGITFFQKHIINYICM